MILTDRQPFTDEDRTILISYKAVVDGVSALIGEHCEIVLHSLEDIEHSASFSIYAGVYAYARTK